MAGLGRFSRSRGGLVTLGIVVGLLVALGATVFGIGAKDHALATSNASAWLYSANRGEIARVNAETGRVDTRFKVVDAQGHVIQVSQTDRYLVLRDLTTGKVSSLDLATLQIAATTETTAGLGVTLALDRDAAFIVDAVQGVVRQLDPVALTPVGDPLRFPPGVAGGTFDGTGTLWLLVASEGTVVGIKPAAVHPGQGTASSPTKARTIPVAQPNHDLSMSTLSDGVAVLDSTAATLIMVQGDQTHCVPLPQLSGNGSLPSQVSADAIPVTVQDDRHVYVINGTHVNEVTVPGNGKLSPAVPFGGRLYVADEAAGTVYVIDADGKLVDTIVIPKAGGKLELQVRGQHLYINAPNSSGARVVDGKGRVKVVDKYANNILGGDPPPAPPPPPPPKPPTVGPPSAPTKVVATAGNQTVHLTWGPANPNGSPILKYVVEGDGKARDIGINQCATKQCAVDIGGLTNGQQYVFTVYAVNAKGAGPKQASNPVVPSSTVPDPPLGITATANKDGTVTVTWQAANGQGRPVVRYDVTQISAGNRVPLTSVTGTTLTIPAGQLSYDGTQYAFTVIAVNNLGNNSQPSQVSNTVVPFTVPGPPKGLTSVPVDAKGTISLAWQPAANNGRPVTGYEITAGGRTQTVTGTGAQIAGFGDNAAVNVSVRAVNAAGPGAPATTTAHTIGPPELQGGTAAASGLNAIAVSFTTINHNSVPTCTISINGGGPTGIGCSGGTVGGLWPGATYNFTVTATNKAGSATFSGSVAIRAVNATVICPQNTGGYCNPGIWAYFVANQTYSQAAEALRVGHVFAVQCWTTGGNVNAQPYGGKNNGYWLRFNGSKGTEYFPDAWARLDDGRDNINVLPHC